MRWSVTLAVAILVALGGSMRGGDSLPATPEAAGARLVEPPLSFVPNRGQLDRRAAFSAESVDASVYFTSAGIRYAFAQERGRYVLALDFVGGRNVTPVGRLRRQGVVSHFRGRPSEWQAGLPTYGELVYRDVWPGVDIVFKGARGELKYDLVLRPGADPAAIRLRYRGATGVAVDPEGRLRVRTPARTLVDAAPTARQGVRDIPVRFRVDSTTVGFAIGSYDRAQQLVIDPVQVLYAGFIGGSGFDAGRDVAVDDDGNAYVAGTTDSPAASFPLAVGPDLTHAGSNDVFVAKVDSLGSIVYAGYIGGSSSDDPTGIAVDAAGNAYVTGITQSSEATFPVLIGPDLTQNGAGDDAFVAKVNAAGTALVYAGYIGGVNTDRSRGIAVDSLGRAHVAGETQSADFPVAIGPDLTLNGGIDAFVARVSASGAALEYSGFIGGSQTDAASGIAVDASGAAYVGGGTQSTQATFPEAVGPDLTHNGSDDVFVAKVNSAGTGLVYAGYVGGPGSEGVSGVAVDGAGSAYVVGAAGASFPTVGGPDLTANGGSDAYVAKVVSSGASLEYAGFIGGTGFDVAADVAVDATGIAYVTGRTQSTEATFPVVDGPDLTHNGADDAFLVRLTAAGVLDRSGFVGGSGEDVPDGLAIDNSGNAYLAGYTESTEPSFPTVSGPDLTANGVPDAFLAKIGETVPSRTLTVSKSGGGSGTVTSAPAGVNCGADCAESYADGTSVTLTAAAASGSTFTSWAGCDTAAGTECGVTMTSDRTATATFGAVPAPAAPTISGLSPSSGSTAGGTSVTISGTDFTGTTAVSFGGTAATSFSADSSTQITAVTPAHAAGTVDVTVTTGAGTSANTSADDFTFVAPLSPPPPQEPPPAAPASPLGVSLSLAPDPPHATGELEVAITATNAGTGTAFVTVRFSVVSEQEFAVLPPYYSSVGAGCSLPAIVSATELGAACSAALVAGGSRTFRLPELRVRATDARLSFRATIARQFLFSDGPVEATATLERVTVHSGCTITGTAGADVLAGTEGRDVICAGAGDDRVDGAGGDDLVYGDGGADVLLGAAGGDFLYGGGGADTLTGGAGADFLRGEVGDDTLRGGAEADSLEGGSGRDTVTYSERNERIVATLNNGSPYDPSDGLLFGLSGSVAANGTHVERDAIRGVEKLVGGAGDDLLTGWLIPSELQGQGGDDVLRPRSPGADTVVGGAGTDWLSYDQSGTPIEGSNGALTTATPAGEATDSGVVEGLAGSFADDELTGRMLRGGFGADVLIGTASNDGLFGGDGNDTIRGLGGHDLIVGDAGEDMLIGGEGADILRDYAAGAAGSDDEESDVMMGGPGPDRFPAGGRSDIADYSDHSLAVVADFDADGRADDGSAGEADAITRPMGLRGGSGDDDLTSGLVFGGAGDDRLRAPNGAGLMEGGSGDDRITLKDLGGIVRGGPGADDIETSISETVQASSEGATLDGGTGNDRLEGSKVRNTLLGGGGDDTLYGRFGDDLLDGGLGSDRIDGGGSLEGDTVSYASRTGPVRLSIDGERNDGATGEDDLIIDAEHLVGGTGSDVLSGNGQKNHLDGGGGNDTLEGQGDRDKLVGGAGSDMMKGGSGPDWFIGGAGVDTVSYAGRDEPVTADADGNELDDGRAGEQDAIANDVENLVGGDRADQLFGNALVNSLAGGPGNDVLQGSAGDWLNGGVGTDTCSPAATRIACEST